MAYFECIVGNGGSSTSGIPLIVTCDSQFAGLTITATKSGAATQTATCPSSSPYTVEFELPEDGTWTVSGTFSGQTFQKLLQLRLTLQHLTLFQRAQQLRQLMIFKHGFTVLISGI